MAKFKVPASVPKEPKVATAGAQPQTEPQQEPPKTRERKPIHPGIDTIKQCLKCGTYLAFREVSFAHDAPPLARPFAWMAMAFCDCGIWTMDQREQIRWIRYSSGIVRVGQGEVYAP